MVSNICKQCFQIRARCLLILVAIYYIVLMWLRAMKEYSGIPLICMVFSVITDSVVWLHWQQRGMASCTPWSKSPPLMWRFDAYYQIHHSQLPSLVRWDETLPRLLQLCQHNEQCSVAEYSSIYTARQTAATLINVFIYKVIHLSCFRDIDSFVDTARATRVPQSTQPPAT